MEEQSLFLITEPLISPAYLPIKVVSSTLFFSSLPPSVWAISDPQDGIPFRLL